MHNFEHFLHFLFFFFFIRKFCINIFSPIINSVNINEEYGEYEVVNSGAQSLRINAVVRPIVSDYNARPACFSANLSDDYTRIREDSFVAAGNQLEVSNARGKDEED